MQAHASKRGHGCHGELHLSGMNYIFVFVYGFHQILIRSTGRFHFVGVLLFCDSLQTHLVALLLGKALLIELLRNLPHQIETMRLHTSSSTNSYNWQPPPNLSPQITQQHQWMNNDLFAALAWFHQPILHGWASTPYSSSQTISVFNATEA